MNKTPPLKDPGDHLWQVRGRTLDLGGRGLIMGILNVTPDSFSDGGDFACQDTAVKHALHMVSEGADIIDVGGESTRPGAAKVDTATELARTIPVIRCIRETSDCLVSVDTSKAEVAEAAIGAGADIINDVTGLRGDPAMAATAARTGAGVVIMHMQGAPRTMQKNPTYTDVVTDVIHFLEDRIREARAAGVSPHHIVVDPGIGFGKTLEHNLALLKAIPTIAARTARPILLGVSKKSFIGQLLDSEKIADRTWPTVALTSYAREKGARIVRVHDVRSNAEALKMTEAVLNAG